MPGQLLTAERLRRVDVRLGGEAGGYLSADHDPCPEGFVLREVRPGELVPLRPRRRGSPVQPLTLWWTESAAPLVVGSVVDVWVNARDGDATAATSPAGTRSRG